MSEGELGFIPFDITWLREPKDVGVIVPLNLRFNFGEFTPHDFRAYYATKIVNIPGMSIEDARDLLGHSDIRTTVRYLRANKEKQQQLIMENF